VAVERARTWSNEEQSEPLREKMTKGPSETWGKKKDEKRVTGPDAPEPVAKANGRSRPGVRPEDTGRNRSTKGHKTREVFLRQGNKSGQPTPQRVEGAGVDGREKKSATADQSRSGHRSVSRRWLSGTPRQRCKIGERRSTASRKSREKHEGRNKTRQEDGGGAPPNVPGEPSEETCKVLGSQAKKEGGAGEGAPGFQ